jgi:ketopantoate reductase
LAKSSWRTDRHVTYENRGEAQTFDEHIRVSASTEASAVQGAQLVLFCVKSNDTESGAAAIKPYLAPDALVLSLQNGVENADRLRALLRQEVAAAVVYVGTEMAGPGHVRHHGRGELVIEPSKASDDVARALIAAGVPTDISDNVRGALWAKLEETEQGVDRIARSCGFGDEERMRTTFQRHLAISPRDYRAPALALR